MRGSMRETLTATSNLNPWIESKWETTDYEWRKEEDHPFISHQLEPSLSNPVSSFFVKWSFLPLTLFLFIYPALLVFSLFSLSFCHPWYSSFLRKWLKQRKRRKEISSILIAFAARCNFIFFSLLLHSFCVVSGFSFSLSFQLDCTSSSVSAERISPLSLSVCLRFFFHFSFLLTTNSILQSLDMILVNH